MFMKPLMRGFLNISGNYFKVVRWLVRCLTVHYVWTLCANVTVLQHYRRLLAMTDIWDCLPPPPFLWQSDQSCPTIIPTCLLSPPIYQLWALFIDHVLNVGNPFRELGKFQQTHTHATHTQHLMNGKFWVLFIMALYLYQFTWTKNLCTPECTNKRVSLIVTSDQYTWKSVGDTLKNWNRWTTESTWEPLINTLSLVITNLQSVSMISHANIAPLGTVQEDMW